MTYISNQAELAAERGQYRHVPATKRQALASEAGAAEADCDFPGHVKTSDALAGWDRYRRAGYQTRVNLLRELNTASGREPHQWIHPGVTALEITQLRRDSAAVRNSPLAVLCGLALGGDDDARTAVTRVILTARRALASQEA